MPNSSSGVSKCVKCQQAVGPLLRFPQTIITLEDLPVAAEKALACVSSSEILIVMGREVLFCTQKNLRIWYVKPVFNNL
jgi:hypothetical protein